MTARGISLLLLGILTAACLVQAQPVAYVVKPQPAHRMELIVEKTGLMSGKKHLFVFPEYQAQLQYDATQPKTSTIVMSLNAARMQCKDDWVSEKDLKKIEAEAKDKILDVAKYPEIHFRSTAIREQSSGRYLVEGMLRIRGMEKPALVAVNLRETPEGLAIEGESHVDMTAWGLKPPSAALGTVGTNKVMTFRFAFSAHR